MFGYPLLPAFYIVCLLGIAARVLTLNVEHRTSGDWYPSHGLAAVLVGTRTIRPATDIGNSEGMKARLIHGQRCR